MPMPGCLQGLLDDAHHLARPGMPAQPEAAFPRIGRRFSRFQRASDRLKQRLPVEIDSFREVIRWFSRQQVKEKARVGIVRG